MKIREERSSARSSGRVIDASGCILGRLASNVAKGLLDGEEIVIVNAENIVISGSKKMIEDRFERDLETRTLASQSKAPKHPRNPENFVRRTIRGMLSWKKPKGKAAYRRLRVYVGIPDGFKNAPRETLLAAMRTVERSVTVGKLLETYGWKQAAVN